MIESNEQLKLIIKKVWEEVLFKQNIECSQQFAVLGGDPSKLVEIVFQLEVLLAMELPIEVLIMMSTIEEMAFAIIALDKKVMVESKYLSAHQIIKLQMNLASLGSLVSQDSLIVKINETGDLPPFFWCFNAPGQETMSMASRLPKNQPLYAMVSSVSLGRAQEVFENITSHYVDEIITLFPEGPYYLGGNCRGAKIMCEIAFRLEAKGKRIDRLCILESFQPRLFDFTGQLMLMFGEKSELQRHKLLNWGDAGWEKRFVHTPDIVFIPCAHGEFFFNQNIKYLMKGIKKFLGLKKRMFGFLFN